MKTIKYLVCLSLLTIICGCSSLNERTALADWHSPRCSLKRHFAAAEFLVPLNTPLWKAEQILGQPSSRFGIPISDLGVAYGVCYHFHDGEVDLALGTDGTDEDKVRYKDMLVKVVSAVYGANHER